MGAWHVIFYFFDSPFLEDNEGDEQYDGLMG